MDFEHRKILVVDDEEDLLNLLRRHLKDAGFEVETALSGAEAKSKAENFGPDLVILDVGLPDIDGISLCQWFKHQEHLKDIPVVFLSVWATEKLKATGLRAGAAAYVAKPFSPQEFIARIEKIMARCREGTKDGRKAEVAFSVEELRVIYYWAEEATNEFFALTEQEKNILEKIKTFLDKDE